MPNDRSIPRGMRPGRRQLAAQVARPAGQVEHRGSPQQGERPHGPPPPADVHAERHDAVDQVVARGDGIEHVLHRPDLVVALGQLRTGGGHRRHVFRNRHEFEERARATARIVGVPGAYAAWVARAHFRIFGIPVRVEPFFVVVGLLFGIRLEPLWVVFAFAVIVFVSVLVHELGHALTYRLLGQRSAIVLHGFGGFTVPTGGGRRALSKPKSILRSLSGALTQLLVLGLPARYVFYETNWGLQQRIDYVRSEFFSAGLWSSTTCSGSASGGRCSTCCRSGRSTVGTWRRSWWASRTPASLDRRRHRRRFPRVPGVIHRPVRPAVLRPRT